MSTSTTATMTPEQRVTKVFELLKTGSKMQHIEGKMTQLGHSLLVAHMARNDGTDDETVLAALMIDIGHLIIPSINLANSAYFINYTITDSAGNISTVDHRRFGANCLRQLGFSKKMCDLIESNGLAKRYLSINSLDYSPSASSTSKESLRLQEDPLFEHKVQLAIWGYACEDMLVVPPVLDCYRGIAIKNLLMSTKTLY
ncbi:hypothetical protein GGI17_000491 [Coemansia sp. S146]|nr:hypothetical protein GGI17_000491 [Coemansia sp. S146]